MKIQDVFFLAVFLLLFWRKKYSSFMPLGLICLVVAIPLFWLRIFFTAERLTWYAAAFFAVFAVFSLVRANRVQ